MQPVDHLLAAVLQRDHARVSRMITDDPDLLVAANMFGATAIHAAHFTGQDELTALLLAKRGVLDVQLAAELGNVDALHRHVTDDPTAAFGFHASGSTPLHGACYWGQVAATQVLVEAGADAAAPTRDEFLQITPLGSAIATTPGIRQPSDDEDVVLELVRLLLEYRADPDARRKDGMTPLHAAAWRGLEAVAQELLDAGADRAARAEVGAHAGETPADTALGQGHLVLAARLDSGSGDVSEPYGR